MDEERGFTLVEMIIVMAVIAALTAISIPVSTGIVNKAKGTRIASKIDQIANAAISYKTETGNSPGSLSALSDYLKTTSLPSYGIIASDSTSCTIQASPYTDNNTAYIKAANVLKATYGDTLVTESSTHVNLKILF